MQERIAWQHTCMAAYLHVVLSKKAFFRQLRLFHIPWQDNRHADSFAYVAAIATMLNGSESRRIDVDFLDKPSIEKQQIHSVQVTPAPVTWMTPIRDYIQFGTLSAERTESRRIKEKSRKHGIIDNKLYRRSSAGEILLRCIDQAEAELIMSEVHEGECGNHAGGRSLAQKIGDKATTGQT